MIVRVRQPYVKPFDVLAGDLRRCRGISGSYGAVALMASASAPRTITVIRRMCST